MKKLTFEFVKEEFRKRNYELLETEYVNCKVKMKYLCPDHGLQTVTYDGFGQGAGCKRCAEILIGNKRRLPYDFIKEEYSNHGYELLETKYVTCKIKMRCLCNIHGEFSISYDRLKQGNGCNLCGNETIVKKLTLPYIFIKEQFEERGYILVSKEYIRDNKPLDYICPIHKDVGIQKITYQKLHQGHGCYHCGILKISGSNSGQWKGGITDVSMYLRQYIDVWKVDSMKNCNWKCILSNSSIWHIHHLKGFNIIVKETLDILKLPVYPTIGEYTEEQLEDIKNKCLELHYELLGVCLDKTLHTLFHSLYGNRNNTPEQFQEFTKRYSMGEFDTKGGT